MTHRIGCLGILGHRFQYAHKDPALLHFGFRDGATL